MHSRRARLRNTRQIIQAIKKAITAVIAFVENTPTN
jgi:hypothetical protein